MRRALGQRFAHVLVDEFQDTDPLQTEIFWRLCGEPPGRSRKHDWTEFRIRPRRALPGRRSQAGDLSFPRRRRQRLCRGARAFRAQDPGSVLSISTNFRSCARSFLCKSSASRPCSRRNGQPGFTALDAFHDDRGDASASPLSTSPSPIENGKATADQQRDAEAEAIAEMCARLIGSDPILDRRSRPERPCQPGDIALLAPTGSDLWRYEEALERRGIPVATQAGKGLFRRQEIQDLIALTRVLADRATRWRSGPCCAARSLASPKKNCSTSSGRFRDPKTSRIDCPVLHLGVDLSTIGHPLPAMSSRDCRRFRRRSNSTTPHDLLSQAVDVLRVRPILLERHRGQAERALANVDLYLSLSRAYAVRGLRAFAEAMTAAWTDESRAVEGRPDAQEEAVALFTMHAAKGLEWPIVIPVNTMTCVIADRQRDHRSSDGYLLLPGPWRSARRL